MAEQKFTSLDMAALSFGAVRYSYIDDLIGSATLVRPAAAPGTSSEYVLEARAAALWSSLVAQCKGCTAATVRKAAEKLVAQHTGKAVELPARSVPVTDFDVASALVASAMSMSGEKLKWTFASADIDESAVARLSDALWMRIGERNVSPALIAYADEYCQVYPGYKPDGRFDLMRDVLAAPSYCGGRTAASRPRPKPVSCLVVGSQDTAAPADLARTWRVASGGKTVISNLKKHGFTDVDKCRPDGR
jgi:hypothetical protein